MKDERKTKGQLIVDLVALRRRLVEIDTPASPKGENGGTGPGPGPRALADSSQVYKNVTEQIPIGISVWKLEVPEDPGSFRCLYRNPAVDQATRAPLHRVLGATIRDSYPLVMETELPATFADVVHTGRTKELGEFRYGDDNIPETVFSLKVFPLGGPYVGVSTENITEVKRAQQAREEALAGLEAANAEASRRLAIQQSALAEIGRVISSSLNIQEVYERFAEEVRKLIPFDRILIAVVDLDHGTLSIPYVTGIKVQDLKRRKNPGLAGSLTGEVVRSRSVVIVRAETEEERAKITVRFPTLFPALQVGLRTFLALPLISRGQVLGVLHLESNTPNAYTDRDLGLADRIASQISGAIANSQLFEQLEAGHERMRWLAKQVIEAQERERQRVSRELHDEAGQALTALKMSLELLSSELPMDSEAVGDRINGAVGLTVSTMENIRLLARGLRPPELDAVGLTGTLEGYCREFAELTGLSITYMGDQSPRLSEAINICFYRYLQEALTNVAKHAQAKSVRVELRSQAGEVSVSVSDDGRGFARKSGRLGPTQPKGIGLLGMRERFETLGGRLDIESRPGKGTRLVAHVPREEYS